MIVTANRWGELVVAAGWRIRGLLVALLAIVALAGCSTGTTLPQVPRSQPSWHPLAGDDSRAAADDVCPKGKGPRGLDCRSVAPGYDTCTKRHQVKGSATLCQQALIVAIECRYGEQAIFHSGEDCAASGESYLACRTGSPRRSDEVCAAAEKAFSRCPGDFDPASDFDCLKAREAYYECRADARGDGQFCSTYIVVLGSCRTLRVDCADLLDKYLVCASEGLSPNECAFGLNMRTNCLRDLKDGVFQQIATCDSLWRNAIRDCDGMRGLDVDGPTPCTGGANWDAASYSICEKQGPSSETVGVAYLMDGGSYRMPICWVPENEKHSVSAAAMDAAGVRGVRVEYRHGETRFEPL
ncbi:hypothetical protein [Nonomuraea zeae]|uniref:Lipoprotein n=1 Tax=Nonomuraea zeae TaxID=1642303 RepID=A0A5S4GNV9_9ACTN|nr:hypothetical protein [Nonomuraea zeae]TMR34638.1 hypothetical protein ETD85_16050 [Nonomuraea zeae]